MLHPRLSPMTAPAIVAVVAIASVSATVIAGGNDVACEASPDQADANTCGDLPEDADEPLPLLDEFGLAVSGVQDLACDAAPSLLDFIACVKLAAPSASTELYTFPSVAQAQEFASVVEEMMTDMDDGVFDCDATVPSGLDQHYRVALLASNGREFCVLSEFLDADLDGYADLGWGTFLYAPDARNELDLQAPHTRVDLYTEQEAVDLFERSYSRSALIGGAHRFANAAVSICQGHFTSSDGDPYYEADHAHNIDTFYAAGKAVAAYYGAEDVGGVIDVSNLDPDFHVLQFHATGVSSCVDEHVFMSNGDGTAVQVGQGAQRLATALRSQNPQWSIRYRGDGSTCNLYGRDNTMARWLNGVRDNGDNDIDNPICSHTGNLPAVSARFVHIEQKRCLSGTACRYGDPDSIRTATFWTQAVTNAFDAPTCTDGLQNGTELGIDCGGSCPLPCGAPTCSDGLQNGTETGIDCGGGSCPACPTCSDGLQNGSETGIDCGGGSCPACPTCSDGLQNGSETGIDCGGGSCPACPTCSDGLQNGSETGIDCGGGICPACACLAPGQGLGCTPTTPCCSGVGRCSKGKATQRVCL